jgi:Protein kinase domain
MPTANTSALTVAAVAPDIPEPSPFTGRQLVLVRFVWISIVTAAFAVIITGLPLRYEKVRAGDPYLRSPDFKSLIDVGVAPDVAATADLISSLIFLFVLIGAGILLFWRASASRQGSFLSLTLVLFGAAWSGLLAVHRTPGPPFEQSFAGLASTILNIVTTLALFNAMFWLPEGRFVTRWTAWLMALVTVVTVGLYLLVSFPRAHDLVNSIAVPVNTLGLWKQVSHYRRVRDASTRQRIKWVVIGMAVAILGFLMGHAVTLIVGNQPGLAPRLAVLFAQLLERICDIAMLGCFAIAIVRYRLWQVDLVINRSLVYGTVSLLLIGVFLGGGLVLQRVLGPDAASIAFALSTIGAAVLFNPIRHRTQRLIDRRLYGFRFDLGELQRAQQRQHGSDDDAIGATIGKYRVLRFLGRGGMGEVYQGECDGHVVAIKVLPPEMAQRDFVRWFRREVQTLSKMDHPNIVRLLEAGETDGRPYIVLDFIAGRELSRIMTDRRRMPLAEVRLLLHDVAAALNYAHERGLVHRDVKPSNIMIRRRADGTRPEAVLMDFGIAKTNDALTVQTGTGAIGTIAYMAPEQIIAATAVDRRADVYSLGVTAFEMLAGEVPFKGGPAQVLFAHLQERPMELRQLVPEVPLAVSRSVAKCLEKKPEDRFRSVVEFISAFSAE